MRRSLVIPAFGVLCLFAATTTLSSTSRALTKPIRLDRTTAGVMSTPVDPFEASLASLFPNTFLSGLDANGWEQFLTYLQAPYAYDHSEASSALTFEIVATYFNEHPSQQTPPFTQTSGSSTGSDLNVSVSAPAVGNNPSGVDSPAIDANSGTPENWSTATANSAIQMKDMLYRSGSNVLPVQGAISAPGFSSDVVVEVIPVTQNGNQVGSNFWIYSLPTQNGKFSADITLPYQGNDEVEVGTVDTTQPSFTMKNDMAFGVFQNSHPSLTEQQMGLLQSWMVNYNESSGISTLAQKITQSGTDTLQKIRDISNWVSSNVAYNWPAENSNTVPWQQATQTLQTKVGVCQDEAAVTAALLRSIGIPAETVQGTLVINGQPQGAHEWLRVYDGTTWINDDPTLDQVYYQGATVSLPSKVVDTYFDLPTQVFAQTHVAQANEAW